LPRWEPLQQRDERQCHAFARFSQLGSIGKQPIVRTRGHPALGFRFAKSVVVTGWALFQLRQPAAPPLRQDIQAAVGRYGVQPPLHGRRAPIRFSGQPGLFNALLHQIFCFRERAEHPITLAQQRRAMCRQSGVQVQGHAAMILAR
jgi:hypothetical protein